MFIELKKKTCSFLYIFIILYLILRSISLSPIPYIPYSYPLSICILNILYIPSSIPPYPFYTLSSIIPLEYLSVSIFHFYNQTYIFLKSRYHSRLP